MSSRWRRFEVLLPVHFNDGRPVPEEWLAEGVLELVDHFGAASYETQKVEGHWRHDVVQYRDVLVCLRRFAGLGRESQVDEGFKARCRTRLEQVDLWMVSYRIEIE